MAYNTGQYKQRSTYLENLDCSLNVKAPPQDDTFLEASFTASSTKVVGVGECVGMIRVAANTILMGAEFYWDDAAPAAVVAIGDPYGCGRILGPIHTGTARGVFSTSTCGGLIAYGTCGSLMKMGRTAAGHEGCGFGYRFTCETDIIMTNLNSDVLANIGGWAGGAAVASNPGLQSVAITAGSYYLVLQVKKGTSLT